MEFGTKGEVLRKLHYYKDTLGIKLFTVPIKGAQTTVGTGGSVNLFINSVQDYFHLINLD